MHGFKTQKSTKGIPMKATTKDKTKETTTRKDEKVAER
jgi:hypothetical protein